MIGGNVEAVLQVNKKSDTKNKIGERISSWVDAHRFIGWLDLSNGDSRYTYDAKLQESTHIFLTDYKPIDLMSVNKRLVADGARYDILLIDDPMGMHQQLEFVLKYVG